MVTPKTFTQRVQTTEHNVKHIIRATIDVALSSGKLSLDIRGKAFFDDLRQVDSVLDEYRDVGWHCSLYLERSPDGKREIVFQPPR